MLVSQITNVKEWISWCSCFSQLHGGSFHCCLWCGIHTDHDHATNQIFCKSTFSCHLKHSHWENPKMGAHNIFILISWVWTCWELCWESEQICTHETKLWGLQNMCWPCCTWDIAAHWVVFVYKISKSMFCSKLYNSWPILKYIYRLPGADI